MPLGAPPGYRTSLDAATPRVDAGRSSGPGEGAITDDGNAQLVAPLPWYAKAPALVAAATLAAIAFACIAEVSTLVADISINGASYSPGVLYDIPHIAHTGSDAFTAWATAITSPTGVPHLATYLVWDVLLDVVMIAGYGLVLLGLDARWNLGVRWLVVALLAADLAEDAASIWAIALLQGSDGAARYDHPVVLWLRAGLTIAKWLALLLLLVVGGFAFATDATNKARARAAGVALSVHRASLLVVGALLVLLVLPGSDILQQAVDIERLWLLGDRVEVRAIIGAIVAMVVLGLVLHGLAGVRLQELSEAAAASTTAPQRRLVGLVWVGAGAALAGLAWLLGALGVLRIYWWTLWCLPGLMIVVGVLSIGTATLAPHGGGAVNRTQYQALAERIGRLLAWSVVTVLLVSIARAYVVPAIVGPQQGRSIAALAGASVLAVAWAAGRQLFDQSGWAVTLPARTVVVVGLVAGAVLIVFPRHASEWLGSIGVVGASLAALAAFYTCLVVLSHQLDRPPHLFRVLGFRRVPIIRMVAVLLLLIAWVPSFGPGDALHRIRTAAPKAKPAAQLTIDAAFQAWTASACTVQVGDGNIRPMLFVAAEGGGARAAWWTVDAMADLTHTDCGKHSVFVASGVSGGAVGLALMAATDEPLAALERISGPQGVSAALDGLLTRDMLAGTFGVDVPVAERGARHPDRATLLEQQWDRTEPGLAMPFPVPADKQVVPWRTIFNSTSVLNGCRALVGDVSLGRAPQPDGPPAANLANCRSPRAAAPGTYDLLASNPCATGLRLSTASLLAARFPYVTPAGDVPDGDNCDQLADQLVDGGYTENSGLDTLVAALTILMPDIRAENETAAAPIVPIVLFLHNKPAASVGKPKTKKHAHPQSLIPVQTGSGDSPLALTNTLLARAEVIAGGWSADPERTKAVAAAFGNRLTATIAPQGTPQVGVPLGWALSGASRTSLDRGLDHLLRSPPEPLLGQLLPALGVPMCFPIPEKAKACDG